MGLDFSIELKIKNKKTHKVTRIEMAYWRKCFSIRDEVMDAAALHSENIIKYDSDYYLNVYASTIDLIFGRLAYIVDNASVLSDSIWDFYSTRRQTLLNLIQLGDWQEFIWLILNGVPIIDFDSDINYLLERLVNQIKGYNSSYGKDIDINLPKEMLRNPDNYVISIEINNSY